MFTLLIVDDEPLIRKGLKNQIPWASIGIERVLDAASGEQALRLMAETPVNIMITDINMREMTGLELINIATSEYPDMAVIVLTGYDDFEYARSCLRMRVRDFLLKPVDEDQLLALVADMKAEYEKSISGPFAFGPAFAQIKQELLECRGDCERMEACLNQFARLVDDCQLDDAQVQGSCFELLALHHFNSPLTAADTDHGGLDGSMAALKRLDRAACVEFVRDFWRRQSGADVRVAIVERAKRCIEEQLSEDVTVTSLAASLFITPAYLSRLFKRATGEGCNEYIVRKRIEQAKALLLATNLKVGEIAKMVGYRDNNYFSLAFKKQTGMSPLSFRDEAGK